MRAISLSFQVTKIHILLFGQISLPARASFRFSGWRRRLSLDCRPFTFDNTLMDALPDELILAILGCLHRPDSTPTEFAFACSVGASSPLPVDNVPVESSARPDHRSQSNQNQSNSNEKSTRGIADIARFGLTSRRMLGIAASLVYSDVTLISGPIDSVSSDEGNCFLKHRRTGLIPDLKSSGSDPLFYSCLVRSVRIRIGDNFCCPECLESSLKDVFGLLGNANSRFRKDGGSKGLDELSLTCPTLDPSAVPVLTCELVGLLMNGNAVDVIGATSASKTELEIPGNGSSGMSDEDFDRWLLEDSQSLDEGDGPLTDDHEADDSGVAQSEEIEQLVSAAAQLNLNGIAPPLTHLLIAGGWRYPDPALPSLLTHISSTLQQLVLPTILPTTLYPISFSSLNQPFAALTSLSLLLPHSTSPLLPVTIGLPGFLALAPNLTSLRIKHRTPKRSMLAHVPVAEGEWGGWSEDSYPTPEWLRRKGMGKPVDVAKELLDSCARGVETLELELPSLDGSVVDLLLRFPNLTSLLLSGGGPALSAGLDSSSLERLVSNEAFAARLKHLVLDNLDIDHHILPFLGGLPNLDKLEIRCVGGFRLVHMHALAVPPYRRRRVILRTELQPPDLNPGNLELLKARLEGVGWHFGIVVGRLDSGVAVLA